MRREREMRVTRRRGEREMMVTRRRGERERDDSY